MIRKIVNIDEEKCNGCGLCIPNCVEGALQIIDGKARLISDVYCDGLGACLGHCPMNAISIIERDAEEFDEEVVNNSVNKSIPDDNSHHSSCPGSRIMTLDRCTEESQDIAIKSELSQWPVQLNLLPVHAQFFNNCDLLISADCVSVAYPNYHSALLRGRIVAIGCPKFDAIEYYIEKLSQIISMNTIRSITVAIMEVPCCMGLVRAVEEALMRSGKQIPMEKNIITIDGEQIKGL